MRVKNTYQTSISGNIHPPVLTLSNLSQMGVTALLRSPRSMLCMLHATRRHLNCQVLGVMTSN